MPPLISIQMNAGCLERNVLAIFFQTSVKYGVLLEKQKSCNLEYFKNKGKLQGEMPYYIWQLRLSIELVLDGQCHKLYSNISLFY